MNPRQTLSKRTMALLICLLMILSILPVSSSAYAAEASSEQDVYSQFGFDLGDIRAKNPTVEETPLGLSSLITGSFDEIFTFGSSNATSYGVGIDKKITLSGQNLQNGTTLADPIVDEYGGVAKVIKTASGDFAGVGFEDGIAALYVTKSSSGSGYGDLRVQIIDPEETTIDPAGQSILIDSMFVHKDALNKVIGGDGYVHKLINQMQITTGDYNNDGKDDIAVLYSRINSDGSAGFGQIEVYFCNTQRWDRGKDLLGWSEPHVISFDSRTSFDLADSYTFSSSGCVLGVASSKEVCGQASIASNMFSLASGPYESGADKKDVLYVAAGFFAQDSKNQNKFYAKNSDIYVYEFDTSSNNFKEKAFRRTDIMRAGIEVDYLNNDEDNLTSSSTPYVIIGGTHSFNTNSKIVNISDPSGKQGISKMNVKTAVLKTNLEDFRSATREVENVYVGGQINVVSEVISYSGVNYNEEIKEFQASDGNYYSTSGDTFGHTTFVQVDMEQFVYLPEATLSTPSELVYHSSGGKWGAGLLYNGDKGKMDHVEGEMFYEGEKILERKETAFALEFNTVNNSLRVLYSNIKDKDDVNTFGITYLWALDAEEKIKLGTYQWDFATHTTKSAGFGSFNLPSGQTSFALVDIDADGYTFIYEGYEMRFSDPDVLAVMASPPYFEDTKLVDGGSNAGNSSTSFSSLEGSGDGSGVTSTFTSGAYMNMSSELSIFGLDIVSVETSMEFTSSLTEDFQNTATVEYKTTYSSYGGQDTVAMYCIPQDVYHYTVYPEGDSQNSFSMEYVVPGYEPVITTMSLDKYNKVAHNAGLGQISVSHTIGRPETYQYGGNARFSSDTALAGWGSSSIAQEITYQVESEWTYENSTTFSTSSGGGSGGATAGYKVEETFGNSNTEISISGSEYTAEVFSIPTSMDIDTERLGYSFRWQLKVLEKTVSGPNKTIDIYPLITYNVTDVKAPPMLPLDFTVVATTEESVTLQWVERDTSVTYNIWRSLQGGTAVKIATGIDGNTYTDNNAIYSGQAYNYYIESVGKSVSGGGSLVSIRSEPVLAVARNMPQELSVNASFSIGNGIVDTGDYIKLISTVNQTSSDIVSLYYQWQRKLPDGTWTSVNDATGPELEFSQLQYEDYGVYRLRVVRIIGGDGLYPSESVAYSKELKIAPSGTQALDLYMGYPVSIYNDHYIYGSERAIIPLYLTGTIMDYKGNLKVYLNLENSKTLSETAQKISIKEISENVYQISLDDKGSTEQLIPIEELSDSQFIRFVFDVPVEYNGSFVHVGVRTDDEANKTYYSEDVSNSFYVYKYSDTAEGLEGPKEAVYLGTTGVSNAVLDSVFENGRKDAVVPYGCTYMFYLRPEKGYELRSGYYKRMNIGGWPEDKNVREAGNNRYITGALYDDGDYMPYIYLTVGEYVYVPPKLTGKITITGEKKVGSTLTATVTETNNEGTLYYEWSSFYGGSSGKTTSNKFVIPKEWADVYNESTGETSPSCGYVIVSSSSHEGQLLWFINNTLFGGTTDEEIKNLSVSIDKLKVDSVELTMNQDYLKREPAVYKAEVSGANNKGELYYKFEKLIYEVESVDADTGEVTLANNEPRVVVVANSTNPEYVLDLDDVTHIYEQSHFMDYFVRGRRVWVDMRVTVTGQYESGEIVSTLECNTKTGSNMPEAIDLITDVSIEGVAQAGAVLRATMSMSDEYKGVYFEPVDGYSYQWKADGVAIEGATSNSYRITGADTGKKISVDVTNKYFLGTKTAELPDNVVMLSLSGEAITSGYANVGETVYVNIASTNATGNVSYQWQRDGKNISGETNSFYKLTDDDLGKSISCVISTSDQTGTLTATVPGKIGKSIITKIVVSKQPEKTAYIQTQSLDTKGLELTITRKDGTSEKVTSGFKVSGYDADKVGMQTITVTYENARTSFHVTVSELLVESISITPPTKTAYIIGESIDTTGLAVIAKFNDGSEKTITEGYVISGFNSSETGEKTVVVSYGNFTAEFKVTVNDEASVTVESVTVTPPTKLEYIVGETFDTTGMVVTANMADGTSKTVTEYTISGLGFSEAGVKTVTVTYEGKTATFEVTVKEAEVEVPATVTKVELNESGEVVVTFNDETTKNIGVVEGIAGNSIVSFATNDSGEIVLTLSDGSEVNLGTVEADKEDPKPTVKLGDANGDGSADAKDATQILRFANGKSSAFDQMDEATQLAAADINGDKSVDAKDATQILRYVNGKTSAFDSM